MLYGGNTVGAVFGCLLAGFYLLRIYNMATATYVAVAINLAVAAVSFGLAAANARQVSRAARGGRASPQRIARSASPSWTVYVAIALSGACALGAEVVWTRLMGMLLGSTVYVFSIILAVFLIGLAMGSAAAPGWSRARARRSGSPRWRWAGARCCWLGGIAWAACMIADSLPYWPINPLLATSPWFTFQLDMVRCLWAILPPACCGAPVSRWRWPPRRAAARTRRRLVGGIYAANTLGAIVGALGVSLVLIPWIGTQQFRSACCWSSRP